MADHPKERQIPLALIGIGLALYVLAAFVHAGAAGVGSLLISALIVGAVQTILLILAAFLVASVMSISFGDARSAVRKFAGATVFGGGLGTLLPMGSIVALFIFLGLVMWLFELELTYAIALTVAYFVVSFGVVILLRSALA